MIVLCWWNCTILGFYDFLVMIFALIVIFDALVYWRLSFTNENIYPAWVHQQYNENLSLHYSPAFCKLTVWLANMKGYIL